MSVRALIEINMDFIHQIEKDGGKKLFLAVKETLALGKKGTEIIPGVKAVSKYHHSCRVQVSLNGHEIHDNRPD